MRGLTLERRNNESGHYNKANCLWDTRKEQNNNQRSNVFVDTPAGLLSFMEAEEISGVKRSTLQYRKRVGWPIARMFDPPNYSQRRTQQLVEIQKSPAAERSAAA
jgi:hypothetical protein